MIRNPSHGPQPDPTGLTGNMIRNLSHGHALSYATQNTQHTQHMLDFRRQTSHFGLQSLIFTLHSSVAGLQTSLFKHRSSVFILRFSVLTLGLHTSHFGLRSSFNALIECPDQKPCDRLNPNPSPVIASRRRRRGNPIFPPTPQPALFSLDCFTALAMTRD